jgi:hypothetical protein
MDGTAAVGTVTAWARADHIHPTDSTRASVASVPLASATTPAMDGTAAVGTGTTFARADHVHASDTSRYAASNPSGYQTAAQVAATVGNYLPLAGGTLSGNLTGPNLTATAAVAASAVFFGQPGVTDFYANASGNIRALSWRAGAYGLQFDNSTGTLTWIGNSATAATLDFGGNLTITGANAIKAGGGSWAAPSDDRLKRNVADYGAGLAEVIRLRPVSFEYNGAGGVKADGATYYGLSAQATQPVMPELVKETPAVGADGKRLPDLLDGQLVTDLGPLTLALVNAVRELSERIEALETPAAKEA